MSIRSLMMLVFSVVGIPLQLLAKVYLGSLVYLGMIAALSLSLVMAYTLVLGFCLGLDSHLAVILFQ